MTGRVLITGASGFIGYHLIDFALKYKMEVIAAVRRGSNTDHLKEFKLQYIYLDFNNVESLKKELEAKQFEYIIHALGTTAAKTEKHYNDINAGYTYNLGLAASLANIPLKKMVFISSLAAIGPLTNINGIINNLTPPHPITAYGRSKLLAEEQLATLTTLPLIILRPTAVYGPRDKDIFIILKQFANGFEPYIGRVNQQLSFLYVKDLASISLNALMSNVKHKSYNLSDGKIYDRYALADFSKELLNKKTFKIHLPLILVKLLAGILEKVYIFSKKTPALNNKKLRELNALNWICDISSVAHDLHFIPRYDLKQGLAESYPWYKKNKWL